MAGSFAASATYDHDSLFSPTPITKAAARRDTALTGFERANLVDWQGAALAFLHDYLIDNPTMFPDDLWSLGLPEPLNGSRRAFGAVVRKAVANGWMIDSGTMRRRTSGNLTKATVWRSLIHQRPAS